MDAASQLQVLMGALDQTINGDPPNGATDASWRKTGLVMFSFPYGDQSGKANYVSNGADRRDMVKFLRETADRFESQLMAEEDDTLDQINEAVMKETIRETVSAGADLDGVAKKLADSGRIVEAGWLGFRRAVLKPTTPAGKLRDMRVSFMAGAMHLFQTMTQIMEADEEPTEADYQRMQSISDELEGFALKEIRR